MNIISIQNFCNYLEELGIVDKKSITPFLSLYAKAMNKNMNYINIYDNNSKDEFNNSILENVLCSYLKKIFNIEKNFKIFSHKIIEKFKQNFLIKQYNGLFLLFYIISKQIKFSAINSYYLIKQLFQRKHLKKGFKTDYIKKDKLIFNNYIHFQKKNDEYKNNNEFKNTFLNNGEYNNLENGNGFNNYDLEYIYKESNIKVNNKNKKIFNFRNESTFNNYTQKAKSLNNSINYMKKMFIQQGISQNNNNSKTKRSNNNYNNIQFENKKNQFLSRIKKEHSITFKKRDIFNNSNNISRIYPIKNKDNKNINYIEYNIKNTKNEDDDSFNNSNNEEEENDNNNEQDNIINNKKINALKNCYSHNNYDKGYDIYHLNKSKTSLENKSSHSVNFKPNKEKQLYNESNMELNNNENNEENDDISSINNSKKFKKNGNLVFNQNFIGMKNLKYNFSGSNSSKYFKKIGNTLNIQELTSNESSSTINNE